MRYTAPVSARAVILTHDVYWAQPPQLVHPPVRPCTPEFHCLRERAATSAVDEALLKRTMASAEHIAQRIASALKNRHRSTGASNGGQQVFRSLRVDIGPVTAMPVLRKDVVKAGRRYGLKPAAKNCQRSGE